MYTLVAWSWPNSLWIYVSFNYRQKHVCLMFTTAALRRICVRIIDVFIEVKDVVGVHAETYFLLKQITKASIFFFFFFRKIVSIQRSAMGYQWFWVMSWNPMWRFLLISFRIFFHIFLAQYYKIKRLLTKRILIIIDRCPVSH